MQPDPRPAAPQRPLGAQISHALKARGVDTIFGIPGVHNIEMYRGIEEAGITHILARYEGGAAFMADGYARASGRPGVCYVITGPGLTNAMTPLGQAWSDSVPVLAISSCLDETSATRGQLHQMRDQRAAAETVCLWSEEARDAGAAFALIDRALAGFAAARPRPCHIQVGIATLGQGADTAPAPRALPEKPQLSDDQIAELATRILAAERPLFVFGGGAVGGAAHVPDLLRLTGGAAFTTYAGRGIVPPGHPASFGAGLARPGSIEVMQEADLLVVFGSELAEVDLWRPALGHECPMIRIDLDPDMLARCGPGDWPLLGDAAAALAALPVALAARTNDRPPAWDAGRIAGDRARWRGQADARRPGIVAICDVLAAALPEDAMIFSDMTQLAYVAKEVWDMPRAGHWHHPYGFGTLGYALPAAIGGAVARPGLPTLAIAGDYGFQYTLQELGTAVELGLPLPILLWDNGKLKEIEESMVASQIAPNAVVARNPDFLALAKAYGAHAVAPGSPEEAAQAVLAAFAADRPTLIRVAP